MLSRDPERLALSTQALCPRVARENGAHDLGNSEIKLLLDVAGAIAHLHAEERVLQEHPAKDSPGFGEGLRDVVWVNRPGRRFGSNHCLEVDG